ncbi:MAG: helix-hairpin-helix domain-containing protein [Chloroflexota bacterium]
MTTILGLALVLLGLAIGFIVTWALSVGASLTLTVGVLLLVAGILVGFISEWLIDEAYRRNRELRRQLSEQREQSEHRGEPLVVNNRPGQPEPGHGAASATLTDFLRQREEDLRQVRDQLTSMSDRFSHLQGEFDSYQRAHPDDLTVIKGIGPVYQWKLRDIGVGSYQQLAAADPDQLRRMLDIKKWQRVNVNAWIEQARDWTQRGNHA